MSFLLKLLPGSVVLLQIEVLSTRPLLFPSLFIECGQVSFCLANGPFSKFINTEFNKLRPP